MKRRSGWRMLGLILLGMILLAIGGGFLWYCDDGDLEAVRDLARQRGHPLEWKDLGLTKVREERLRLWQRVVVLTDQIPSYQAKLGPDYKVKFRPWDPIPEEMRAHHATIDTAVVTELADLLDRLGDQPLVLHDQISIDRKLPEYVPARVLLHFMQERVILSEPHEAAVWSRRMLAQCRRYSVDCQVQLSIHCSLVEIALKGIAVRLADLKMSDPGIAKDILATLARRHADLLRAIDGDFLILLGACTRFEDPAQTGLSAAWDMRLVIRATRRDFLITYLDTFERMKTVADEDLVGWSDALGAELSARRARVWFQSITLQGRYLYDIPLFIDVSEVVGLRGRLIAAELQGTPWPRDTFDATGATLRPIHHDGRVIAAYSVGHDGVDQGGGTMDKVFPLYADPTRTVTPTP